MSALISASMIVAVPSVAKTVAPRKAGQVSFSARVGVSNATEKKTSAFMVWKSQGNKCVPARERDRASATRRA